ncbi:hypothetical protein C7B64_20010 [Merismopedia glauca CCAP 1448/3]|uniref:Uncharacterized protein n=1 Tax=Merismopedia glauca CCAP 1448/3 TaxID=1296344 RepID=A0A2T1BYJ2_9CYAN|nr:hypothetical protein C7B64_20010 [Merismopedia glauca CCAP 1448/3]
MSIQKNDISSGYTDFPAGRPLEYSFFIAGEGWNNILSSFKLLTAISQNMINNCQSVSLVTFGPDVNTDAPIFDSFGLMPNGKVKLFECTSREDVGWGYIFNPAC